MPTDARLHVRDTTARRQHPVSLALLAALATVLTTFIITVPAVAQSTTGASEITHDDHDDDDHNDVRALFHGKLFGLFPDGAGSFRNATDDPGVVNRNNAFFDPRLGTNGQACVTCHRPNQGFSIQVPFIRGRFEDSQGRDPLFRANDTADRPDANLATLVERRQAFQLFLTRGVVRIGKTLPAAAEFTVVPQSTPRFGPLPNPADPQVDAGSTLSLFRRPLVTTNIRFDTVVLWDGRQDIHDLRRQVKAAARTLLLGRDLSDAQADNVASFMTHVFTAQVVDARAGRLSVAGARGGVQRLKQLATSPTAPCVPMTDPTQATSFTPSVTPVSTGCVPVDFTNPDVFTLFRAWEDLPRSAEFREGRAAIARGEQLFNARDLIAPGSGFHCRSCHATTNIGNSPNANFFIRLGLDSPDALRFLAAQDPRLQSFVDRTADLPVYTLSGSGCPAAGIPNPQQAIPGTTTRSTDPGRAMVTGKCADFGRFKPPILRDLVVRAPFFHNGAAETLDDVVNFYNARFTANFTQQEHNDLVAFLQAL